ncbi:RsfA family transcriptional regulator [Bacillus sp. PS06]|uniref:RsfA family transcriptional regulator n=1 Tax=Bacillus sp. PS06 TaxID=2764176 RepID=UPI0017857418|nr:RsfA family transcriptional regulator [Bacillus sp. PS06]MBD8069307.1 RsfA family transcriptional regulator [Bacillus sp. PS06]
MKVRQDAWSHEDDLLLAETVLRYIREGGTQLGAFEEVGDHLNRTSAACGFRWNAEVRKNYEQAIAIAKRQRKERKRALERMNKTTAGETPVTTYSEPVTTPSFMGETRHELVQEERQQQVEEFSTELLPVNQVPTRSIESITLEDCISFLSNLKNQDRQSYILKMENDQLQRENDDLRSKNNQLEKRIEKLTQEQTTIQEDYQALVQIMDRARRMVMFEDNEDRNTPTFRMDQNGNLEQVAK